MNKNKYNIMNITNETKKCHFKNLLMKNPNNFVK